ncbi:MAG: hypothetical protein Q9182_007582 [Xanthomendoza sp. 2 TL-2023]
MSANIGSGYSYRSWNYAKVQATFDPGLPTSSVCMDTGCGVLLADRKWLLQAIPEVDIHFKAEPLKVRGVGTTGQETREFAVVPIHLPGTVAGKHDRVLACIKREVDIVDNLRANMLIGNYIIGPEQIVIDIAGKTAHIGSCNINIKVDPRQRGQFVRRTLLAQSTIVPPHSEQIIPVVPYRKTETSSLNHHNKITCRCVLPYKPTSWFKKAVATTATVAGAFQAVVSPSMSSAPLQISSPVQQPSSDRYETKLPNGIMVYGSK